VQSEILEPQEKLAQRAQMGQLEQLEQLEQQALREQLVRQVLLETRVQLD
jgi:uncharacterized protein YnzC (UPF0291/DUF896 family)